MSGAGDRPALVMPSLAAPTAEKDDLDDFAPRARSSGLEARRAVDQASAFPSREAPQDGQLNLKGPRRVIDRFRAMCKADRRPYYAMLEILMDERERGEELFAQAGSQAVRKGEAE